MRSGRRVGGSVVRRVRRVRLPVGWRRAVLLRRVAAGVLAVLAVVVGVLGAASPEVAGSPVVVANRDLVPGPELVAEDVAVVSRPPGTVPVGALAGPDAAVGGRLVGGVRAGEVLTDVRMLGPESARASAGAPDAAGVPLRLADPALAGLVRPGAVVDVVGGARSGRDGGAVLASGARVLAVLPGEDRSTSPVVVVALPGPVAARVAAATIGQEVTLTLR
ncbi:SAF domain-containing protein [Actinomycetospora termitidis]|uniref:SAF domain-containing protein n=1 Tax=Actinomycetospora termitidis TaxID=3053470 RepID=A0ABT7MLJ6_9PSEU|nr:SAF domain-containing protein [Actinomycetospora sp. Odt1-22]MDL5160318.1 SAF domain-containing protein [Actinomycetospora sp. Odt1-22]